MIYLDNAATTQIAPEVLAEMLPCFKEQYGNAGTLYALGRQAAAAVQEARRRAARMFSCPPEQVVFTSGGSESNSTVFHGLRRTLLEQGKTHLVVSAIEHDSVLRAAQSLTKDGFYITYVKPQPDGTVLPCDVAAAIRADTGLVSVMCANNETGAVNDIAGIGKVCREAGVLYHSDCVQAAGQYAINAEESCLDFASISSHKIHGPKGVGALYARHTAFSPLVHGGSEQEFGLRGGTENVPGIVGFGKACEIAADTMGESFVELSSLKRMFVETLRERLPSGSLMGAGIFGNGRSHVEPGKVLSLCIDGVSGETLVLMLDAAGVCISAGSACRAHEATPSHVLTAMGLSPDQAGSCVRISFSKYNTKEEVRQAAALMAACIELLRDPDLTGD